jgi:glycosyltransferase involved in cell wall biosynthesis
MNMTEIRILHIIDKVSVDGSKIHGPARQISYRVPYYDSMIYKIMLCNLRREDAACELLRKKGIEVISLNRSKFNPFTLIDILQIIKNWKPSLLHLHGYASWNFGRIAGKIVNVPIIIQEHFVDSKPPFYQRVTDRILKNCHHKALAVSDSVKEFMIDKRCIDDIDIEIIGNGVPTDNIRKISAQEIKTLKSKLEIPLNHKVVGNIGRLAKMKGQDYFIQAADIILKQRKDFNFIIVGEGPLNADLKEKVKKFGIDEYVKFVGFQEDVYKFLSLFDVAVIASIYGEGFCSVGIEAFAVDTPVVITDHAMVDKIYIDKENVLMVPKGDAEALAKAILKLFNDQKFRSEIIANGLKTLQICDSKSVAGKYLDCYAKILGDYEQ